MHERGPFDRILQAGPEPDRTGAYVAAVIVGLAVLLLILVLPPVSILSGGGGEATGITTSVSRDLPRLPDGFQSLSSFYDISVPEGVRGSAVLTVNLRAAQTEGRNIGLYTFQDGKWRRLGGARLVSEGMAAQGEVPFVPSNVAVLRRTEAARQVTGWLPAGAPLDERAASAVSVLNPVDYAPAADGSLIGGPTLLPPGAAFEVAPTVRAASSEEVQALDIVLSSPELRSAHQGAIAEMARSGGYSGVDLDYRAIGPTRANDFVELVQGLAEELHRDGRTLTLVLPLPVREGAEWNTGGYDWEELAAAADFVKLAPEPDGALYYRRTEEALEFLSGRVDRSKLLLVVGGLSREKSGEGIRTLTLTEALGIASAPGLRAEGAITAGQTVRAVGVNLLEDEGASGLYWDEEALAVTFSYPGRGGKRTVWISNSFSVAFKLDLARRYGLGGVALEDVSTAAGESDVWPTIQEYADSGSVALVRPNGELLAPHWLAGAGSLDTDVGSAVQWQAPLEPGFYELTLVASDGVVRVGQRLTVEVGPPAGLAAP